MRIGLIGLGTMGRPMALHLIAAGLQGCTSARKTVVDMSSISPMATKAFARKINALGADDIDAPVSGGEVGAKAASLTIMCGGAQEALDAVLPLLQLMARTITLVGGNGDGQTTKVANQIIVALPQTANAAQLMQACAANGMADLDHSALVKALELMAGHAVAPD